MRHALALDTLILMVANIPWQKQGERAITPATDRLAMVEAAVADVPGLAAGRLEIEAGGPSYTADTLAALARQHPGAQLFTVVGDDAAAGLHTWERFEEVLAQSSLVVVDRPGNAVRLPDDVDWIHVEVPRLEVSSTDLRARFSDGRPLDYLLTDAVLNVIEERTPLLDGSRVTVHCVPRPRRPSLRSLATQATSGRSSASASLLAWSRLALARSHRCAMDHA